MWFNSSSPSTAAHPSSTLVPHSPFHFKNPIPLSSLLFFILLLIFLNPPPLPACTHLYRCNPPFLTCQLGTGSLCAGVPGSVGKGTRSKRMKRRNTNGASAWLPFNSKAVGSRGRKWLKETEEAKIKLFLLSPLAHHHLKTINTVCNLGRLDTLGLFNNWKTNNWTELQYEMVRRKTSTTAVPKATLCPFVVWLTFKLRTKPCCRYIPFIYFCALNHSWDL